MEQSLLSRHQREQIIRALQQEIKAYEKQMVSIEATIRAHKNYIAVMERINMPTDA